MKLKNGRIDTPKKNAAGLNIIFFIFNILQVKRSVWTGGSTELLPVGQHKQNVTVYLAVAATAFPW